MQLVKNLCASVPKILGPSKMFTISVDGNISSGKSTLVHRLLDSLQKLPCRFNEVQIIPEPLEKWCNLDGNNLLELYYQDPVKNNFVFQHYVQLTRLKDTMRTNQVQETSDKENSLNVRLMERSLQNNRHCFLELAKARGDLSPVEFAVLTDWYAWLEEHLDLRLDVVVYLRTDPDTVYSRMKSRGRSEESTVPLDYLKSLHQMYENWLIHRKPKGGNVKTNFDVIVVDGNQTKEEVVAQAMQLLTDKIRSLAPEYMTMCPPST